MFHEWILLCTPVLCTRKPILKRAMLTRPPTEDLHMQLLPVNKSEKAA